LDADELETSVSASECWKSYSFVNVKQPIDKLKFTAVNDCWKKLWSKAVMIFVDSQTIRTK
jgi:hypothetical protein